MAITDSQKDFLVSYAFSDSERAKDVAQFLKDAGYSVVLAELDFPPGTSFVGGIQDALKHCARMVPVLSAMYFEREWTNAEWQSFMTRDPDKKRGLIIPVRVEDISPEGLWADLLFIDWVGKSPERRRELLLGEVQRSLAESGQSVQSAPLPPPAEYIAARKLLREDVQSIPIFGKLYPPISMEKSFLRLSLNHRPTEAREGFYQWEYPQLPQHFQLTGKPDLLGGTSALAG